MGTRGVGESKLVAKGAAGLPRTARVLLDKDVAAEDIHAMLDRIFEMHGCSRCGLLGLDLLIHVNDPKVSSQIQDMKGVLGMEISA